MNQPPPKPELRQLVDRLHDGPSLGRMEMARLEELLSDDAALAYYVQVSQSDALLPGLLEEVEVIDPPVHRPFRFRIARMPVLITAAACVAFFLGLGIGRRSMVTPDPSVAEPPVRLVAPAKFTGLVGVEWGDGRAPDLQGGGAANDRIFIKTGLVEVTYASGVRMTLEGPADYRVLDAFSGRLEVGKIYATVPKGAEGFRIDYAQGSVIDLGTEFAMEVRSDGGTEVGVFEGEVELHRPGTQPISLFKNQALIHDNTPEEPLRAVPLDREKYVRDLPTRDFRWAVTTPGPQKIEIDVSHLVWKPSEYRAVFKWIEGPDIILIRDVRLFLDDQPLASDLHTGKTGLVNRVSNNVYTLSVPATSFRRGKWTIRATLEPMARPGGAASGKRRIGGQGILQFEEGLVSRAGPADFIGRWSYHFLGDHFVRNFHPDGTVSLEKNGEPFVRAFAGSRWLVENGELRVTVPKLGITESHILRDGQTLIFVSQPYENAVREGG